MVLRGGLCSIFCVILMCVNANANESGIVCGAYIGQNRSYADNIAEYEQLCDVSNSVYLIDVNDDGYPHQQVLECYGQSKVPMLLINNNYNMGRISSLAEMAGEYNLPIFLCIKCESEEDLTFYKYCVDIFRIKAPKTKFVQSVSMSNCDYTFAGIDYVDFLAINATLGAGCCDCSLLQLQAESADVPVIFNLAVSHYTEKGHSYYYYDKMNTLNYIFDLKNILTQKLYGINYINVNYKGQKYDVYTDEKLRVVYSGDVCKWSNNYNLSDF